MRAINIAVGIGFLVSAVLCCGDAWTEEDRTPTEPQSMIMSQSTPGGDARATSAVEILNYIEGPVEQEAVLDNTAGTISISGAGSQLGDVIIDGGGLPPGTVIGGSTTGTLNFNGTGSLNGDVVIDGGALPPGTVIGDNTTGTISISGAGSQTGDVIIDGGSLPAGTTIGSSTSGTININGTGSLPVINQDAGATITMTVTQPETSQQPGNITTPVVVPAQTNTGTTLEVTSSTVVSAHPKAAAIVKNLKSKIRNFASSISEKFSNIVAPKMRKIIKPRAR